MPASQTSNPPVASPSWRATALAGAILFVASYLAVDVVVDNSDLPMPDATVAEVYDYATGNAAAFTTTGVLQLVSVAGLAVFVIAAARMLGSAGRLRWGHVAGLLAVTAMVLSSVVSFGVATWAPDLTADTVGTLRMITFRSGGVAHVAALGCYVLLTRGGYASRGVGIFGVVATVPALLSLLSLVVFLGNAFILLGRLLCMAWIVVAAISLVRAKARGTATELSRRRPLAVSGRAAAGAAAVSASRGGPRSR